MIPGHNLPRNQAYCENMEPVVNKMAANKKVKHQRYIHSQRLGI